MSGYGIAREMGEYGAVLMADPCAYCTAASEALDHIEPLSRGGATIWQNLAGVCKSCNGAKRTHSLLGFLGQRSTIPLYRALTRERRAWGAVGK